MTINKEQLINSDIIKREYKGHKIQQRMIDGYINISPFLKITGKDFDDYLGNLMHQDMIQIVCRKENIKQEDLIQNWDSERYKDIPKELDGIWVYPFHAYNVGFWLGQEEMHFIFYCINDWLKDKEFIESQEKDMGEA